MTPEEKLKKKQEKEEKKKKTWAEFKKFILRGNIVDMAVGVAVASAFTAIVNSFTKGFITPILSMLTNDVNLADLKTILRPEQIDPVTLEVTVPEVAILWGTIIHAAFDFIIIAVTLFTVMKIAASVKTHYEKISKKLKELANEEAIALEKKKAEEEKAKADEAARLEAEAKAAEAARLEAELQAERDRLARQEALLCEIRDLLKAKN